MATATATVTPSEFFCLLALRGALTMHAKGMRGKFSPKQLAARCKLASKRPEDMLAEVHARIVAYKAANSPTAY